ncbi:MAG: ribosomal-processing cysteine protease Prp [Coprococcus sp.]
MKSINVSGFRAHGHAGFSEDGQDIVCAAVSVLYDQYL